MLLTNHGERGGQGNAVPRASGALPNPAGCQAILPSCFEKKEKMKGVITTEAVP